MDQDKSKAELIAELQELRGRLSVLQQAQTSSFEGLAQIITLASTRMIALEAGQIDAAIEETLGEIGRFTGVDRSYVFLLSPDGNFMVNTHEWCAPGVEPQIAHLQALPVETFPWWIQRLRRLENISVPRVSELGDEAGAEKAILEPQGVQSLVGVPLIQAKSFLGFLGFDVVRAERQWQEDEIRLLRITADIFSNALIRKRVEEELKERSQFVNSLLRAIPVAVFFKDKEGRYLGCNDVFMETMGVTAEDIRGKTVAELWPGEVAEGYHQKDLELMRTRQHQVYEFQIVDKHGQFRPVIFAKDVFLDANGEVAGLVGAFVDITERKQAELALQESERRYRLLAENTTDVIWTMDLNLRSTYTSPAVRRLRGYDADEAVEQPLKNALTPASLAVALQALAEELELEKKPGRDLNRSRTLELEVVRMDGSAVWTEATVTFLRDPAGTPVEILGVTREITERKQAERQLRESEERFRTLANHIPGAVYLCRNDAHYSMLYLNDAVEVLTGYPKAEFLENRLSIVDLFHPDDMVSVFLGVDAALEQRQAFHLVYRMHHRSGEWRWVEEWGTGVFEGGNLRFLEGFIADITERKRADDALKKASEDLMQAYDATLQGWSNALELREHATAGHSKRAVRMTIALARALGVPESELVHMQRGALLHDIGKMGIPDSILLKPGPLDDQELVIMRQHPVIAHRLLSLIPFLEPALDIPYSHHEKWDGTGYPRQLRGAEIPLAARIFAVVDVWDALTHDRPYRPAWREEAVLAYLEEQSGSHFDPAVVRAFLQVLNASHA